MAEKRRGSKMQDQAGCINRNSSNSTFKQGKGSNGNKCLKEENIQIVHLNK